MNKGFGSMEGTSKNKGLRVSCAIGRGRYLIFESSGLIEDRPDLRAPDLRFLNVSSSRLVECFRGLRGLQLPADRPDTDTDIDMDMEVAESDVEMEARLPAESQSFFDFCFDFPLGFTGLRRAAATSASLEVPVRVDTGLVLVEAIVC